MRLVVADTGPINYLVLGVLDLAARRGLIDLAAAFGRLKATNFRCRPEIMDALLAHESERQK